MHVELLGGKQTFLAGSTIKGLIHINQHQPFASSMLQIKLYGFEKIMIKKRFLNMHHSYDFKDWLDL